MWPMMEPLFFIGNNLEHTFRYGYLCITHCEKSRIVLQKGETISHRWLSPEGFLEFVGTPEYIVPQWERWRGRDFWTNYNVVLNGM